MSDTIIVCFDVVGSVQQEIEIVREDISKEQLIEKLNSGEYLTTLEVAHPDIKALERTIIYFDEEGNEVDVAVILSQTMGNETQYTRFQLDNFE